MNETAKKLIKRYSSFDPDEMERLMNKCEFSDLGEALKQAEMIGAYQVIMNILEEMDNEQC